MIKQYELKCPKCSHQLELHNVVGCAIYGCDCDLSSAGVMNHWLKAAPVLLDALEALLQAAYRTANKDHCAPFTIEELAQANDAIKKAKGE